MKKYIKVAAVFAGILLILTSCIAKKAKNEGYTVFRSSPIGVEIEYPKFWEMAEDKKARTVAFATPSEGYSDNYRENVTVCSYQLDKTNEMAFDNYVTDYIDSLPSSINGYNLVSENDLTVGESEAYRIVYEGDTSDGKLRLQQTFIKSDNYVYIYSYIAEPKSYEYFLPYSETMLETFKALRK